MCSGDQIGDVVEQQHPLAQASRPHLETRSVARKGVVAVGPETGVARLWCIGIVLAVIQDDLEHPAGVANLGVNHRLIQQARAASSLRAAASTTAHRC